jgi:RHS repeat-associated protein
VIYAYDAADRLTRIVQSSAVVDLTYDAAHRRTTLTLPSGVVTAYTYDAASRLTALAYRHGGATLGTLAYGYDAVGNRVDLGGTWARTALPEPVASATYNAANQQLTFGAQALTYDANGNVTGDGSTTYTWDARNRLAALAGPGLAASFQYDALGRRMRRTVNGTAVDYLYDGLNPVIEKSGAVIHATMLTGLGVDEYLTRTDTSGTRAFLTDALGSTIAETDATAVIQAAHTYEPFGAATTTGISTSPYLFTGREDDDTGLYYFRARYYDPDRARFLSEDPLHSPVFPGASCSPSAAPGPYQYIDVGPAEGLLFAFHPRAAASAARVNTQHMHPYVYATNNPMRLTDPMGLFSAPPSRGCDVVGGLLEPLNPCATSCCDAHDQCYSKAPGWCSMWSWTIHGIGNQCLTPNAWGVHPACCQCNVDVVRCILRGNTLGPRKGCPAGSDPPLLASP